MTSNKTKYPYCRRRYQQAAAYEKYLQTMHLDIIFSHSAIADMTSIAQAPFLHTHDESELSDTDYTSDTRPEIADCHAARDEINEYMQNDPDVGDACHSPVRGCPSIQQTISRAGRLLSNVVGYTDLNKAMTDDPWSPFSSEDDFNLASWLIRSKVAKSQIDAYFTVGLGSMDKRSFQSTYT